MFYQVKQLFIFGCLIFFWGSSCTTEDKFDSLLTEALRMEKREKYQEALYYMNEAIGVDSTKSFAYVIRGKIKSLLNDENGAIADFKQALLINPINTAANFHYGISLAILE